jgi:hypothetical protein
MKVRRFHQAFKTIPEPWFDATDEEELLEHGNIFLRGFVVLMGLTADRREVRQLSGMMGEDSSGSERQTNGIGDTAVRHRLQKRPTSLRRRFREPVPAGMRRSANLRA